MHEYVKTGQAFAAGDSGAKEVTKVNKGKAVKAVRAVKILLLAAVAICCSYSTVWASGTSGGTDLGKVQGGLETILGIFQAVVVCIGAYTVLKNGLSFSSALQERDSSGMNNALLGIAGGGVALASAALLQLFK